MTDRDAEEDVRGTERKKMNEKELEFIRETEDWRADRYRGAATENVAASYQGDILSGKQTFQKSGPEATKVPSLRQSELSLMHCNLLADDDRTKMWALISEKIEAIEDTDPMQDGSHAMIGNVYDHGNFCEYRVGLFEVREEDKPVLDFKRMSGSGFVMDEFFRKVKSSLPKEYYFEEEVVESDEFFDDYSDSEKYDDEELTSYGYLQLSYDKNLVSSWVEKIKTRHLEDQNHIMGLMAYNATQEDNLKIIMEKGGRDLKNLIKQRLEESNSAALVRNASALAAQMTKVEEDKEDAYDSGFVDPCFNAMMHWVPGNDRKNESDAMSFDITESRETVKNLVEVLFNLNNGGYASKEEMTKEVSKFHTVDLEVLKNYLQTQADKASSDKLDFVLGLINDAGE